MSVERATGTSMAAYGMVAPVLSVAVFPRDILAIVFMDGRMGSMERETKEWKKTQL